MLDKKSIRLSSLEIKKSLSNATDRESSCPVGSTSSWAHEGYLVAAEVLHDDDFLAERERLAASVGIGIVQLDRQDLDASFVRYPAKVKDGLDWEPMNKWCDQNTEVKKFVEDVKIDFDSKRIHRADDDDIPKDPATFIAARLKIAQTAAADG